MGRARTIARRTFLIGSAAVAGGVVFGYWRYKTDYPNPLLDSLKPGEAALTPYVRIDQQGITVITPRAEMGQGVHTTLAAMVAEELDVELDAINVEHGPASKAYFNGVLLEEGIPFASIDYSQTAERVRAFTHFPAKLLALQMTGGSTSTPDGFVKMRKAGAAAREVLIEAAAKQLGANRNTLKTRSGYVESEDGRSVAYTELATLAADIEPPSDPELRPRSKWRLLGKSQPRVDVPAKSTGTATYSIDVRLPDMLFATIKMNPVLGAGMNAYDPSDAENMPGVRKIVPLEGGVAVVATNTWYAVRAANAIRFDWDSGTYPATTEGHFDVVKRAFADKPDSKFRDDGDVDEALIESVEVDGEYKVPYLAHATMEPVNAVAYLRDGKLDIWAGNQAPIQAAKDGAKIAGVDQDDVTVHTTYMGGAFGRRAEMDFIKSAVHVATAMEGTPVLTTWTREEDTTHDNYRPLAIARFRANVSQTPTLDLQVSAPSVAESQFGRLGMPVAGPDITIAQAAWDQPYAIPNYRVRSYRAPVMLPVSSWRAVGASQNGFFHESAIDEMAYAADKDPLEYRLALLKDNVSRGVLEKVAELSNWGDELPDGHARGVAFVMSFGVPVAEVIEVQKTDSGIRLVSAYAVVDVGVALDPRNIEGQVESGIIYGLTAAMQNEITVRDGRIEQQNFNRYDSLRIASAPDIAVAVLENGPKIRGIGEPGLPPAAPALANAVFAATGQRIRELPLNKHIRFV